MVEEVASSAEDVADIIVTWKVDPLAIRAIAHDIVDGFQKHPYVHPHEVALAVFIAGFQLGYKSSLEVEMRGLR